MCIRDSWQWAAMRTPGAGAGKVPGARAPGWGATQWHAGHATKCQRDGALTRRQGAPRVSHSCPAR
eukprot:1295962-Alexandrium_andersonii.AAC.1